MPVDVEPRADGTFALYGAGDNAPIAVRESPAGNSDWLYVSHFATCPFADQHRKGRAAATSDG